MSNLNSFIIASILALVLCNSAFASDCDPLNKAMKNAYDNANEMAVTQVESIMRKPDFTSLESCLGGLSASLGSFTLPGLPDLNDLLNQACEAVVDTIYDKAMAGVGDDLKNMDMTVYRTNDPDFEIKEVDVDIREPDIDLKTSIEDIFN